MVCMQLIIVVITILLVPISEGNNRQPSEWAFQQTAKENVDVSEPKQSWGYVNVRKDAYMFWWLYFTTAPEGFENKPLVIWLQGGPGASSTGFGNFAEIGPLDVRLQPRNTSWLSQASLLFIDNPVGSGFSYVTSDDAYTKNNKEISQDLLTTLSAFLQKHSEFQDIPLFIFSESYGGKMAAEFSQLIYQNVQSGSLKCDLHGVALGDSWISPLDSVLTWGPYLFATSLIDEEGLSAVNEAARQTEEAFNKGAYINSTMLWDMTEGVIEQVAANVNMYNILKWGGSDLLASSSNERSLLSIGQKHLRVYQSNDDLSDLMNGPIRKKLGIIPDSVTWGGQSSLVFSHLSEDFMKPVVDIVSDLLDNTTVDVTVYSGQLDLIVDTLGTERWVQKMKWKDLPCYNSGARSPFFTSLDPVNVAGFYKNCKKFTFYWILEAGHMIPSDAGDAALTMLKMITKQK